MRLETNKLNKENNFSAEIEKYESQNAQWGKFLDKVLRARAIISVLYQVHNQY